MQGFLFKIGYCVSSVLRTCQLRHRINHTTAFSVQIQCPTLVIALGSLAALKGPSSGFNFHE